VTEVANQAKKDLDTLLVLYQMYDRHREALLWFLHELSAKDYSDYRIKYAGTSKGRMYFTSVCGFFELAGVLVNRRMLSEDLFFDVFNPTPFWQRAKSIVEGMRQGRPHIYENFELLSEKRKRWSEKRPPKVKQKMRK